MIDFPDYERATNAAYNVLQNYNYVFPKIDVGYIISIHSNVKMCSYSKVAKRLGITHNKFTYYYASSEYGFTVADYSKDRFIIYYNDWKDEKTLRFTIVHELGHIILKHKVDNETTNREANCFARNILCPVQIVKEYKLSTPHDYMECFGISEPMAEAAIGNFESDMYYISNDLYNNINDKIYCYMTGYTLSELYGYA